MQKSFVRSRQHFLDPIGVGDAYTACATVDFCLISATLTTSSYCYYVVLILQHVIDRSDSRLDNAVRGRVGVCGCYSRLSSWLDAQGEQIRKEGIQIDEGTRVCRLAVSDR